MPKQLLTAGEEKMKKSLESLNKEYQQMNFDVSEIQEKLSDPENLTLLKDVLNKLG